MLQRSAIASSPRRMIRTAICAALCALNGCDDSAAVGGEGGRPGLGNGAGASSTNSAGQPGAAGESAVAGGATGNGGSAGSALTAGSNAAAGDAAAGSAVGGALIGNAGGAAGNGGDAGMPPFAGAGSAAGSAGTMGLGGSGGAAGNNAGGGNAGDATHTVLFDGSDLGAWKSRNGGGSAPWRVLDGAFAVVPNSGDIETRQAFGDVQLHVEFWIPKTPTTNEEQDRGNSGIYLQGRYEVQVLDSYQHPLEGANDCGAIYEVKNADVNAALAPETWQTYEITFRAPRWSGQTKTENAKISVVWNGQMAQRDTAVPAPTRLGDAEAPGDAPLRLQDHGHGVRYRNVWLQKL